MNKKLIVLTMVMITASLIFAGCISQEKNPGDTLTIADRNTDNPKKMETPPVIEPDLNQSTLSSRDTNTGKSYFNVRIVPVTELERLQKEMESDESLVKNDKDYVIGIISPESLTIRGDLVQLERGTGSLGKEFDKNDVILHLLDITFGLDNSKITLFKSDKKYKFWLDGYFTDSEVKYVKNLSALFNGISGTTQFEDEEVSLGFLQTNYAVVPNNFYNIKIVTEKLLNELYDDRKGNDHLIKDKNGKLIGMVNVEYLYLINTLSEDEQKYQILRGLLYSMGLHGISYQNKESFFYRNEGQNRNLSDLDIETIRLLYGGGLKTGDTLEDAKKTLGIPV